MDLYIRKNVRLGITFRKCPNNEKNSRIFVISQLIDKLSKYTFGIKTYVLGSTNQIKDISATLVH